MADAHGSDTQKGPDWWMASDGRWYPPELHPDYDEGSAASARPSSIDDGATKVIGTAGGAASDAKATIEDAADSSGLGKGALGAAGLAGAAGAAKGTVAGGAGAAGDKLGGLAGAAGDKLGGAADSVKETLGADSPVRPANLDPGVTQRIDPDKLAERVAAPDPVSPPSAPPASIAPASPSPVSPPSASPPPVSPPPVSPSPVSPPPAVQAPASPPPAAAPSPVPPRPSPSFEPPPPPGAAPGGFAPPAPGGPGPGGSPQAGFAAPQIPSPGAPPIPGAVGGPSAEAPRIPSLVAAGIAGFAGLLCIIGSFLAWGQSSGDFEQVSPGGTFNVTIGGLDASGKILLPMGILLLVLAALFALGIPQQLWWAIGAVVVGGIAICGVVYSWVDINGNVSDALAEAVIERVGADRADAVRDAGIGASPAIGLWLSGIGGLFGALSAPFAKRG